MPEILHVEGSRFFRKIIEELARKKGCRYISASTPVQALEILQKNSINLIITGKELEQSSGEDLINKLINSPFKNIPIVVISSDESKATQEHYYALGIVNYLHKSELTENRLSRYLDQLLKEDPLTEELRKASFAVVDDSEVSRTAIRNILAHHGIHNVTVFGEPKLFLDSPQVFDVYFVDLIMPVISGEEVIQEIRSRFPRSLIFAISAVTNINTISYVLNSGADDYIIKPLEAPLAMARLRNSFRTMLVLKELEYQKTELERLAIHDGLTGAFNHRWVLQRLEEEMSKADRYHRPLSVLMTDIDHFKQVNDTEGHLLGDEVLRGFVDIFKSEIRESDIFGRYGGDEFLLVMPETDLESAVKTSERIRLRFSESCFGYSKYHGSLSGGVVNYSGQSLTELISEADQMLYLSKKAGRNRISFLPAVPPASAGTSSGKTAG